MTLNQRIIGALQGLRLQVVPQVDTKHRDKCITFNYEEIPFQFTDNRPNWYKALIQVHLIYPVGENSIPARRGVLSALTKAGFPWPEIVDASDEDTQHFIYETEAITPLKTEVSHVRK